MSQQDHSPSTTPTRPKRRNPWQWFKSLSLFKKIATIGAAVLAFMIALPLIIMVADPEGFAEAQERTAQEREEREAEREAEEEAERLAEEEAEAEAERIAEEEAEAEQAAQEEAEEERQRQEEEEAAEAEQAAIEEAEAAEAEEAEPEIPEGLDAQVGLIADLDGFDDASIFVASPDDDASLYHTSIHVDLEIEIGLFVSSTCRDAQNLTIDTIEFVRDRVTDDYDRLRVGVITRGESDATGSEPIIGLVTAVYDSDTVDSIDSDSVRFDNVWQAMDDGSINEQCR